MLSALSSLVHFSHSRTAQMMSDTLGETIWPRGLCESQRATVTRTSHPFTPDPTMDSRSPSSMFLRTFPRVRAHRRDQLAPSHLRPNAAAIDLPATMRLIANASLADYHSSPLDIPASSFSVAPYCLQDATHLVRWRPSK